MAEIASAHVTIYPKFSDGFASGVKREVGDAGDKAGRSFSDGFGKATGAKGGKGGGGLLGGAAMGIKAGLIGIAAGVSFGALTSGFQSLTGAASDLNETVNKSQTIFGANYGTVEKWAGTAATSMGLSKQAALEAASGFGDMFLQLGFAGDTATEMSKKVVQMSADFGSFNNLPTAEVSDMIAASLRGEYDSLQRLVPTINAAAVEQQALAETGKKSAKELTAQEKATATLTLITKGAERATGDFAKTSDGAANKAKINAARTEELAARFGGLLGPIQAVVQDGFEKLLDVGTEITAWAEQNPEIIEGMAAGFELLGGVIGFVAKNVIAPMLYIVIEGFSQVIGGIAGMLRALGSVPGFEWATEAADKLDKVKDGAHAVAQGIDRIATEKTTSYKSNAEYTKSEVKALQDRIDKTPAEKRTQFQALINSGQYAQVDYQLNQLGRSRTVYFRAVATGTPRWTSPNGTVVANAYGDGGLIPGFAGGGTIPGWSPHPKADNILIAATAGEFMQPVAAVDHYGVDAMEAVRKRKATISYADGGSIGQGVTASGGGGPLDLSDSTLARLAQMLVAAMNASVSSSARAVAAAGRAV